MIISYQKYVGWKLMSAGMVTNILCKRKRMDTFSKPPYYSFPVWDSRVDPLC